MGSIFILQAAQCPYSGEWFNLDWKDCHRKVRSLQNRIVKSVRNGEWRKVKRLCYLLTTILRDFTYWVHPLRWVLVMPEPYARKPACAVLGELGGGDAARLPGAAYERKSTWLNGGNRIKEFWDKWH
ncbi:MAG TPA: hypothetical protein ENI80_01940 [Acidiferrobacteraceae bacterium]|nr:hypothetical protein [Acidiferrobacteraceae bacterium]